MPGAFVFTRRIGSVTNAPVTGRAGGAGVVYCQKDEKMAVPKKKTSPSRRNMRRSHHALKAPAYVEDKDSGELRRPHHIDLATGMYRGKQILEPK